MNRTTWPRVAPALVAGILLAGCSPAARGGEGTAFAMVTGFSQGGPASTIDTVDIGVPGSHNVTGHSIRWERVSLVSAPPAVHLRSVSAYGPGPGVGVMFGNMLKDCLDKRPYPVTAAVTPPHAETEWNIVLAINFAKPGRYDLRRVKILYVTNGHRGWQYQNLNTTMVISAPRKGAKPYPTECLP